LKELDVGAFEIAYRTLEMSSHYMVKSKKYHFQRQLQLNMLSEHEIVTAVTTLQTYKMI